MQMVSILDKLGPSSFRALKYYMLKRGILGYATLTKHSELLYDQCIYLDGGPIIGPIEKCYLKLKNSCTVKRHFAIISQPLWLNKQQTKVPYYS